MWQEAGGQKVKNDSWRVVPRQLHCCMEVEPQKMLLLPLLRRAGLIQ